MNKFKRKYSTKLGLANKRNLKEKKRKQKELKEKELNLLKEKKLKKEMKD
jgi:hypothetical protein